MRVLLVNPHVPLEVVYGKEFASGGAVLPPLGLLYLASYLKTRPDRGWDIEILDANALELSAEAVCDHAVKGGFHCVGLTATTLGFPYAAEIARRLRRAAAGVRLVLGGAHAQGFARGVLEKNPGLFDFVCYGEGEYAFESLLEFLDGRGPADKLLGWVYVEDGRLVETPPAPIPNDLDVFGHPSDVVDASCVPLYHEKILGYKKLPLFSVFSSRGCPFRCLFCSTPRKYDALYEKRMRYHSVDWICREFAALRERFGVQEVMFADDIFNLVKARVEQVCDALISRGIDLAWSCNFKANYADLAMMRKMKQAGCWSIMVGAESGSDRILRSVKKGTTAEQVRRAGDYADQVGITSRVSFILGLPGETRQTVEETLRFVRESSFHFPYFQLYIPLPGTDMFDDLGAHGEARGRSPAEVSASAVNFIPSGLTEDFLAQSFRRAHRDSYLNWTMAKRHLKFLRSFEDVRRYWQGLRMLARL